MAMAVPPELSVQIARPDELDWARISQSGRRVLVLVRDVREAEELLAAGLAAPEVNLGNVHFGEGRRAVTPSIYLSGSELEALGRIEPADGES
jgi:PTS system mannose-specific IIB component